MLNLAGFLVGVAVWPWFIGFATTPRWAVLSVLVPVACLGIRVKMTRAHWFGAAFLAFAVLGLIWSPVLPDALDGLWTLAIAAGAFCLGAETDDLTGFFRALALSVAVSAVVVCFQLAGVSVVTQFAPPAGLFGNRIFLAEFAALAFIGTAGSWLMLPCLFVLATATSAGALIGVSLAATWWLWGRIRWAALALPVLLVAGLVAISPVKSTESGFARHLSSAAVRIAIWSDVAEGLTVFGHGVGSYYAAEAAHSPRQQARNIRETHAHNDPLELVFEAGVGALLLAAVAAIALRGPPDRARLVLVALLAESCFGFPWHNPATAFVGAVVAGHLCGAGARLRNPIVARRESRSRRPAASWVAPV